MSDHSFYQNQNTPALIKYSPALTSKAKMPSFLHHSQVGLPQKNPINLQNSTPTTSPNKYKFEDEKMGNFFKLRDMNNNQENMAAKTARSSMSQKNENNCSNYRKLLTGIEKLSSRVCLLEREKKYEKSKENFELHQRIERIVMEQTAVERKSWLNSVKKIEEQFQMVQSEILENILYCAQSKKDTVEKVEEMEKRLREKIEGDNKETQYKLVRELESWALEKNEQSLEEKEELEANIKVQMENMKADFERELQQMGMKVDRICENLAEMTEQHGQLKSKMETVSQQNFNLSVENLRNSIFIKLSQIEQKIAKSQRQKIKQSQQQIFKPIIGKLNFIASLEIEKAAIKQDQCFSYLIDSAGFLLDDQNQYLLASDGKPIHLSLHHLAILEENGLLNQ